MEMRILAFTAALTASALLAADAPKVVFVCEHGAAKSIMAAAEFRKLARDRGFQVQVLSRGTIPDAEIAAGVKSGLQADGLDAGMPKPLKVTAPDLAGAARVVSFGPDLSALLPKGVKALDWSSAPSPSKDYRAARDHIRRQLQDLFQELEASKP
jgi:arsenate reductase (thioredoxin)